MGEYWVGSHFSLLPNKVSVSAVMHYPGLDTVASQGVEGVWREGKAHPHIGEAGVKGKGEED